MWEKARMNSAQTFRAKILLMELRTGVFKIFNGEFGIIENQIKNQISTKFFKRNACKSRVPCVQILRTNPQIFLTSI